MFCWCGVFYLLNVAANPYALVRCELISTILLSESKYFIIFTFLGHLLVIPCKTTKAFIFFNPVVFTESHCYKQVCVTSSYAVALLMVSYVSREFRCGFMYFLYTFFPLPHSDRRWLRLYFSVDRGDRWTV